MPESAEVIIEAVQASAAHEASANTVAAVDNATAVIEQDIGHVESQVQDVAETTETIAEEIEECQNSQDETLRLIRDLSTAVAELRTELQTIRSHQLSMAAVAEVPILSEPIPSSIPNQETPAVVIAEPENVVVENPVAPIAPKRYRRI